MGTDLFTDKFFNGFKTNQGYCHPIDVKIFRVLKDTLNQ